MHKRLLWIFLLVVGQQHAVNALSIHEKIKTAESLMYSDPVKGLDYLKGLIKESDSEDDSTRGYLFGLVGTCFAMTGELDSAQLYISSGITLLPLCLKKVYALKNLGSVFRMKTDYSKADSAFSVAIADLAKLKTNPSLGAVLLGEKATVCIDQGQNRVAMEMLKEGLSICRESARPDSFSLAILGSKLAIVYMNTFDYDLAVEELEKTVPLIDENNDLYNYCTNTSMLARAFLEQGDIRRSKKWLDISYKASQKLDNKELEGFVLMLMGKHGYLNDASDEALGYFEDSFQMLKTASSLLLNDCATEFLLCLTRWDMNEKAMSIINDPVLKKVQRQLTALDILKFKRASLPALKRSGDNERLLYTYAQIIPLMDSVSKIRMDQTLMDSRAQFKFEKQESVKKELEQSNRLLAQENQLRNSQIIIFFFAFVASLFLVSFLVVRYRKKTMLQQKDLDLAKQEVSFKQKRLEWESKLRNMREKVIEKQKYDLLEKVDEIDKLRSELVKVSDESHKSLEEAFAIQVSDPRQKVGLEQFLQQFNSVFPNFFPALSKRYPGLSTSDLQFCALMRMNLSIKDISSILAIEPKSTYKKKYRIEEKMDLSGRGVLERVLFELD